MRPTFPAFLCWLMVLALSGTTGYICNKWATLVYFSVCAIIFALFDIAKAIERKSQ